MKNSSITLSTRPLKELLRRFHLTIFFIFIATCLAASVLLINTTLEQSVINDDYTSPISAGTIDQATLDRIKSLHTSAEAPGEPQLPPGRINPFGE